jgi:two-component SAPR family response regulator
MGGGSSSGQIEGGYHPVSGHLSISVVGRGAVTVDGQPVRFATRHAELALYLLALAGSEGLGREDLIVALWPGVEPRGALPRLRTALWQVRRALGGHARRIERERGMVTLDLEGVELDVPGDGPIDRTQLLIGWNFAMPPQLEERVA